MAEIKASSKSVSGYQIETTWTALANGDTGSWEDVSRYADRTVTMTGTFGGGTLTMQGSNDGTNAFTLHWGAAGGTTDDIVVTGAGGYTIYENPRYIRPSLAGGSAGDVDIIVLGTGSL